MSQTQNLLDIAKRKRNLTTDYELAKALGWPTSQVSGYRTAGRGLADEQAMELAEFANLDPSEVLLSIHADRTKSPRAKKALLNALERIAA